MNTNFLAIADQLSDDVLLANVKLLAQRSRAVDVELIADLAVLDARKLHRGHGTGRLFGYCTEILRFSEAVAYNLIKAARAARKFPVILDLLTDGSVNLTTVRLLAPHLTAENHRAVLAEVTGMTRRQVEKIVARLAPQPDVPPSIRKLPARTPSVCAAAVPAALTNDEVVTAERREEEVCRDVQAAVSPRHEAGVPRRTRRGRAKGLAARRRAVRLRREGRTPVLGTQLPRVPPRRTPRPGG